MSQHNSYHLARTAAAIVDRRDRGWVVVSGADRRSYLPGLLTNDITALQAGQGCSAAYLTPQGRMIADLGGADICYSGPGWAGHLAFIDPDAPEFAADSLDEWKKMGPRVCTLHPLTIAQNSLHGSFGMSGDLAAVPPKAATIGPAEVIAAKERLDIHAISIDGSFASWQRFTTRLVLHGPVTPKVPESILQTADWLRNAPG